MKANIVVIIIVGLLGTALIIFMIARNKKDWKKLNPDADDIMEETMADQQREMERD